MESSPPLASSRPRQPDQPLTALQPIQLPPRGWLRSFKHQGPYEKLLVHPDGARLIAVERLGSAAVWSLADGRLLHSLTAELSAYEREEARNVHVELHPDGVRLFITVVVIDCSDVCFCWDLDRGELVTTWSYPQVPHHFLDGDLALTPHGLYLSLWSLRDGAVRQQRLRDDMSWWMHDARPEPPYLALVPAREALELWDVEHHRLRWALPGCFDRHPPLAADELSEDDSDSSSGSSSGDKASPASSGDGPGPLGGALFLPGGEILLSRPGALEVRSPDDASVLRTIPCPGYGPLAFHRPSQCVVVLGRRQLVALDVPSGAIRSRFTALDTESVAFSADGRHAVVTPRIEQERAVWELATGRCRLRAPLPLAIVSRPTAAAVPDSVSVPDPVSVPALASPTADTAITVDGAILREWPLGDEARATHSRQRSTGSNPDLRSCPAGRVIVTSSYQGTIRIERSDGSAPPIELTARNRFPWVLALEPEARRLVISSEAPPPPPGRGASLAAGEPPPRLHTLELWRGTSPPLRLHTFRTVTRAFCAAFAPSRRWLVSCHADGSLHLWDLKERRRAVLAELAPSPITELAISPASDRLVTFSADHILRGFRLEDLQPLAQWDSEHALYDLRWLDDETITATSDEGEVRLRWPRS